MTQTAELQKVFQTWSSVTSKIILGFFLSSAFFAWQALTDLKDHPPVPQNTRLYTVLRTCYSVLCMERDIIQSRGEWPQTKYNLTNVFGYLNPFYTFCGVQIIPDKNIQIVKCIFRFSFFLFQKFSKNSKIFRKKIKKGKVKEKVFWLFILDRWLNSNQSLRFPSLWHYITPSYSILRWKFSQIYPII